MNDADRRTFRRILQEYQRQVESAPPSSEIECLVKLDRSGHIIRTSGVRPPRRTVDVIEAEGVESGQPQTS